MLVLRLCEVYIVCCEVFFSVGILLVFGFFKLQLSPNPSIPLSCSCSFLLHLKAHSGVAMKFLEASGKS